MATIEVNGAALHYEERGSGPPLLLVHGTGSYADVWSPVLDGLARTYRVIAYDRRGFARSSDAPRGALADQARDAAQLLEALDAFPATVVGWSGGGVIALDLAASYRDLVAALVLARARGAHAHPSSPLHARDVGPFGLPEIRAARPDGGRSDDVQVVGRLQDRWQRLRRLP